MTLRGTLAGMHGKRGQAGFTLIELLVVVTILGLLAAVVTLSLIGVSGKATANACKQDQATVQTAIDTLMADQGVSVINGVSTASNDMTIVEITGPPAVAPYPNYTRQVTSKGKYTISTTGLVALGACP